jgi:hypothetical protein
MRAFENRMGIGQTKFAAFIQVALEAHVGRFSWIDDGVMRASALIMQAAGPMTRLAADFVGVRACRLQSGMSGRLEPSRNVRMAFLATLGSRQCGARDLGRDHNCSC